jgi:hypothetical protein
MRLRGACPLPAGAGALRAERRRSKRQNKSLAPPGATVNPPGMENRPNFESFPVSQTNPSLHRPPPFWTIRASQPSRNPQKNHFQAPKRITPGPTAP